MKLSFPVTLILIICFSLTSCENSTSVDQLQGTWSCVNPSDSTYDEIYFTKEFLIHNLNSIGIRGVHEYVISNDSVYLVPEKVNYFNLLEVDENRILIIDQEGNNLTLERINLPTEAFRSFCISDGRRSDLQKGRLVRGTRALLEKGLMKKNSDEADSILFIPEPER